ncbi:YckD family protein [Bacillus sp. JJ1562]|uniref:YckD family protein n=1 Tax=Bacillus sp. JJ1562 TaxID=3122960 RepID=UPI003001F6C3
MKRWTSFVLLISFFLLGGIYANAEMEKDAQKPKIELTDKQKQELDKLYLELLETKKTIINKYVEFGVLPKEKADTRLNWLDEHYQKIREQGYIPMHHHKKHRDDKDKIDHD